MDKYAYMDLSVKYALGKSYYVCKIPPVHTKNRIITVSVFLCNLQLTTLLSKSFRHLLHSYTLKTAETRPGEEHRFVCGACVWCAQIHPTACLVVVFACV